MVDSHFHVQLTAVLDVLMKTAVSDICVLAESWFKSLHLELARSKKENEDLKQKLQRLEQQKQQQTVAETVRETKITKEEKDEAVSEVRHTDDSVCMVSAGTSTKDSSASAHIWPSSNEEQKRNTAFCHICVKEVGCLQSHLQWHDQNFQCRICHKMFHNKVVFSRHVNTHTGAKHACDVCRKTFGSKSGLLKHISNHKRDLEKCKDCNQEFPTKQTLYSHREKTHTLPKQCPFCELRFSRNSNLKKHLLRHSSVHL